ncbi:MAG: YdcF family protein [Chloroflexota bacterium]|nr:YdcF family protein [Chloroflexota bacterium]
MLKRLWLRRALRVLLVIVGVWLLVCIGLVAAITVTAQPREPRPTDAIIVLGAGVRRDGSAGPTLTRRAHEGARLYTAGYAPVVICTGGTPYRASRAEAEACADVLRADGVPESAILLETSSRSTEENAAYTRAIFDARGWETALVVSDGYHLLRAGWIFQQQGIDAQTAPTSVPALRRDIAVNLGRELVALHWQVFKTALNLPYTFVPWV